MKLNEYDDLVSVIIPFYNEEVYFDDCIYSVINQTYQNLEVIIVNDGSEEKFKKKLDSLNYKYPNKIKLFHIQNEGVSSARNYGIKNANGKYICFLDADDFWLPNKIEHQIKIIKEKNLNFIHSSYYVVDQEDRVLGRFKSKSLSYKELIKSCDIGLSTVLVSADILKKNLFPDISTKEDYICWLNIIKKIPILYGDKETLVIYRKKKNSLSSNVFTKFKNAFKVYHKFENFSVKSSYTR